ncbi:carboxypeptidase-like regulatory domain-containing protein [Hymenobacter sp. 5516J-16]|uniref:Carboxypeptidase-like regulatory domain-containing protein n=1 Tax=Hymenobacter sublimis TaxID=2933777 RepID=A0ABY4JDA3_9BACT|nr:MULTISPECIES: carboxypeptidase-like regulatory domain-containing protein [Hymenobacter]UOQ77123.1 carboxypeptidase-like regulatory domain-containing protein [Hymenobacter sp. 5516J-16]UPL50812.1 carboxypeptidase-like regulatory domain-containing protein [Hymenobacter sublimis]
MSFGLRAQNIILEGRILHTQTNEPVPFATLGVPGRGLGTVADEQGRYLLRLPSLQDTLVVTCVGFSRQVVLPAALAAGQREFRLAPQEQALGTVVVEHRRVRPGQLGRNKEKADVLWTGGSSGKETVDDEWGWELGTVLRPTRRTYLEEFHVFLSANTYEHLRFRLNLYVLEQGRPGRALLSRDVQLVCSNRQRGWLTVDLRPYEIMLEAQPVVATVQWLQSEKTNPWDKYFSIPVTRQPKQVMVERENSEAAWTLHELQPSLYFTVLTE